MKRKQGLDEKRKRHKRQKNRTETGKKIKKKVTRKQRKIKVMYWHETTNRSII